MFSSWSAATTATRALVVSEAAVRQLVDGALLKFDINLTELEQTDQPKRDLLPYA